MQGATNVTGYFPKAAWHALWNGSVDVDATKGGRHKTLATPLGDTNVHVRGGTVVPLSERGGLTTAEARAGPISLLVALQAGLLIFFLRS